MQADDRRATLATYGAVCALVVGVAVLYAPSLAFGFFWDDPLWFGRVAGHTLWEVIAPQPTFQFYRPATLALNWLFARADGTFDPWGLHLWQISLHLLNIVGVARLARVLGYGRAAAVAAALLFAVYPWGHQAVAWAAPQQPAVTACLLGTLLAYAAWRAAETRRARVLWFGSALALYGLALAIQESAAPYAVLFFVLEWHLAARAPGVRKYRRAPLVFAACVCVYLALWALAPKVSSFTRPTFAAEVALYLAQGLAYPVLGQPGGWDPAQVPGAACVGLCDEWVATVVVGCGVGLSVVLARAGQARVALLALTWYGAALLPGWAGLPAEYLFLSPRTLYPAGVGVALLWAGLVVDRKGSTPLWWVLAGSIPKLRQEAWRRKVFLGVGWVVVGAIAVQSVWLIVGFNALYARGTQLLDAWIAWADAHPSARVAFVNFPDRYAWRRPPYPIGYWGVTLAPIAVDLSAYPARVQGVTLVTASYSAPELDGDLRAAGPYHDDLRGSPTSLEDLYAAARVADAVLLTRFTAAGGVSLHAVGHVVPGYAPEGPPLARFGAEGLALYGAELERGPAVWRLSLRWQCRAPVGALATVFVHVGLAGQAPRVQADGDWFDGLLPLDACRAGDGVFETRELAVPAAAWADAADLAVRLGVYDRASGARLPAYDGDGQRLLDDAWVVR